MVSKALIIVALIVAAFLLFTRAGGRLGARARAALPKARLPKPSSRRAPGGDAEAAAEARRRARARVDDLKECPTCGQFRGGDDLCVCARAPTP